MDIVYRVETRMLDDMRKRLAYLLDSVDSIRMKILSDGGFTLNTIYQDALNVYNRQILKLRKYISYAESNGKDYVYICNGKLMQYVDFEKLMEE